MCRVFTPRHAQMARDSGFALKFNAEPNAFRPAPLPFDQIVPIVTIGRVTLFIPCERPNVKHSIAGHLRLPRPTPAPALMRELHWYRS